MATGLGREYEWVVATRGGKETGHGKTREHSGTQADESESDPANASSNNATCSTSRERDLETCEPRAESQRSTGQLVAAPSASSPYRDIQSRCRRATAG